MLTDSCSYEMNEYKIYQQIILNALNLLFDSSYFVKLFWFEFDVLSVECLSVMTTFYNHHAMLPLRIDWFKKILSNNYIIKHNTSKTFILLLIYR